MMRTWMVVGLVACFAISCKSSSKAPAVKEGFEVHDMKRPQPVAVTPPTPSTQDQVGKAPSDAIVLFDGKDLSQWKNAKGEAAGWKIVDGTMEIAPKAGNIQSKGEFGDVQLHVEWCQPEAVKGKSQGRGNSGVFLMGLYECQVLDCYQNETYPDGATGCVYGQYPPLVNACLPPGKWHAYDIVFHPPKYSGQKVVKPARMTVFLNGILVQDDVELIGPTKHKELTKYPTTHPAKGPISLQDHGNPVRFRNIWVREIAAEKPKPPVKSAGAGH